MTAVNPGIGFMKGHGTGNDFVLLPDLDDRLVLGSADVRSICDRRRGVGADGILRVVPSSRVPEAVDLAGSAAYFMDHRNADGSLAQMCGNGARVFARYVHDAGLEAGSDFSIATRAGLRAVRVHGDGQVTVAMGPATTPRLRAQPLVQVGDVTWPAVGVQMPNPHAVVFVDDLAHAGDLLQAPTVVPESVFPDGVNVEFVRVLGADHIEMRVHERGVGQTLACGTGACAAAWATWRRGSEAAPTGTIRVDMPGGTVQVTQTPDGLELTGPAVFVAQGHLLGLPSRW